MNTSPKVGELGLINRRLENLQKRDPDKSLKELYAGQPNVLSIITEYNVKKQLIQAELDNANNTSEYALVDLNRKIKSDPELLTIVDGILETCSELTKKNQSSG